MDAGVLRKVDPSRIVRRHNSFDVEALCEKAAFLDTRCPGAGGGRNHLGQHAPVGSQQLVGERREERSDAVGRDDPPRCRIPRQEPVPDVEFVPLHGLDSPGAELSGFASGCR